MNPLLFIGMIVPWLIIGLALWLGFQFLGQMGRMLLRLEAIEQKLQQLALQPSSAPVQAPAPVATGLHVGSVAPLFDLPDLSGKRSSLADYRGHKTLLIFFNPQCGYCTQMLPALAALPVDHADGRPLPLVITTGNGEENRRLFQEKGVRCPVLLQNQMTVAGQYQVNGTPMGYLVDEKGLIASPQAIGAEALLALAVPSASPKPPESNAPTLGGKANLGLEASRINRDGLKAGTKAPDFQLPRLDGGLLSLRKMRGRQVLLVFSDPQCGPCDQLAPHLEVLHSKRADLQIIMVSRRELEENRAKAAKLGLTFPVVLQKQWEISMLYGMFATPVAYLINKEGVISADVAVGVDQILALVGGSALELSDPAKRNGVSPNVPMASPQG